MMQVFKFLKDSRVRHITKSITWRIVGTIDTMVIAWLVTGKLVLAFTIGSVEVFTKIALYYFHERAWYRINFGLDRKAERLQRVKKNGVSKDILTQNFNIKQNTVIPDLNVFIVRNEFIILIMLEPLNILIVKI